MNYSRVCKSSQYSLFFKTVSWIYELVNYLLLRWRLAITYYFWADLRMLMFINELRIRRELLLTVTESMQLCECVKAALKIKGDLAEVGVYRGGSAKLIAHVKGARKLHLFDTFAGLPSTNKKDQYFLEGEYSVSISEVQDLLKNFSNVSYHQGVFPKTASQLKRRKFSFVHLDVDLHQSTLDGLRYFYPQMSQGGMILVHDYPSSVGVKRAVSEFVGDNYQILKLSGNQGLIVKI